MKITAKLSKNRYDFSKDHETHLLIELEAPKVEWDKERAPICIIPVLDVSGSMAGEKIEYLKKACRKLFTHLSPGDFAGIVAYDTAVYEVAPIREITQYQKDDLKEKVSKLKAGSCTNLSGGLSKAFEWINGIALPSNVILRVLVFTDGLANVGITGRALIDLVKENKNRATISAFGFGFDCQQELLADMATAGGGNYAFIDSPEAALTAFARELGGLMSTYGQVIKVTIVPDKNNSIIEVLNDEDVSESEGIVTAGLKDILGEEKKWVVAKVKLNKVEKPLPRKVVAFKANVSYNDKNGQLQKSEEIPIKIKFCKPEEEPKEEDVLVVQQRDKLLAAKAQEKAEAYVRVGDYTNASAVIFTCANSLADGYCGTLMREMAVNYSSPQNYSLCSDTNNSVRSALKGQRVSHTSERARRFMADLGAQYTSVQEDMVKNFAETNDDQGSSDVLSSGNLTADSNVLVNLWSTTSGIDIVPDQQQSSTSDKLNYIATTKKRSDSDW